MSKSNKFYFNEKGFRVMEERLANRVVYLPTPRLKPGFIAVPRLNTKTRKGYWQFIKMDRGE